MLRHPEREDGLGVGQGFRLRFDKRHPAAVVHEVVEENISQPRRVLKQMRKEIMPGTAGGGTGSQTDVAEFETCEVCRAGREKALKGREGGCDFLELDPVAFVFGLFLR